MDDNHRALRLPLATIFMEDHETAGTDAFDDKSTEHGNGLPMEDNPDLEWSWGKHYVEYKNLSPASKELQRNWY